MRLPRYFILGLFVLASWLIPSNIAAQDHKAESTSRESGGEQPAASQDELFKLDADVIRTTTEYKKSLEKLLAIYESDFRRLAAQVVDRRELYEKGYVSRLELGESERSLAGVEAKIKEIELKISEAKIAMAEAAAHQELLKFPFLAKGEYRESAALIRYDGTRTWSLAEATRIVQFFKETFGRLLPISAVGQTPLHDRLKFDHRDAMDVALHPDSREGRTLMTYLRQTGVPFIAFRDKVSGSATGAHIHIGKPSFRVISP